MFNPHDRILFIGDSITDAFRKPEEINIAYQLGAGYALLIAAKYSLERPSDNLTFINRGISGHGVIDLLHRWDTDCLALEPNVVSVLVGVNECIRRFRGAEHLSIAEYEAQYNFLLERTRQCLPNVRLVVCEPFLLPCGEVTDEWIEDIKARGEASRRVAEMQQSVFVPLQRPFEEACALTPPEYWAYDGIHPTAAGFGLIARQWIKHVEGSSVCL